MKHFGLERQPFEMTPNVSFYCHLEEHDRAHDTMLASLNNGEGFIKITGEVGTGKTVLCQKLISNLDPQLFKVLYIPNPYYSPHELRIAIAEELGMDVDHSISPHQLEKQLMKQLDHILTLENKRVVILLDEAQLIPDDTLEVVRLMTNLRQGSDKNLQLIMVGQPELDKRLQQPHMRQLAQRIAFAYRLSPLDPEKQSKYIEHRLHKAGFYKDSIFSKPALKLMTRYSGGIPRVINILAHKAMLAAYSNGDDKVTKRSMKDAINESKDILQKQTRSYWPDIILGLGIAISLGALLYMLLT